MGVIPPYDVVQSMLSLCYFKLDAAFSVLYSFPSCRLGQDVEFDYQPRHDKTNKVTERPANTQFSLGIRPV